MITVIMKAFNTFLILLFTLPVFVPVATLAQANDSTKVLSIGNPKMSVNVPLKIKAIRLEVEKDQKKKIKEIQTYEYNNGNPKNFYHVLVSYTRFAKGLKYDLYVGMQGAINSLKNNTMVTDLEYSISDQLVTKQINSKIATGSYKISGLFIRFKIQIFSNEKSQWTVMTQNTPNDEQYDASNSLFDSISFK